MLAVFSVTGRFDRTLIASSGSAALEVFPFDVDFSGIESGVKPFGVDLREDL